MSSIGKGYCAIFRGAYKMGKKALTCDLRHGPSTQQPLALAAWQGPAPYYTSREVSGARTVVSLSLPTTSLVSLPVKRFPYPDIRIYQIARYSWGTL